MTPSPVPVAFGDCFGWYHPADPGLRRQRGLVLCPAFGVEALRSYRNMRVLAALLAEGGMPVLRFDYPGTGDSLGEEAPHRLEQWPTSVVEAVSCLRRLSGIVEVALCGLGLGALLAAEAARLLPGEICSLVLLAPVVFGADYARELALRERAGRQHQRRPNWVEVAGFSLHTSDVHQLESLSLSDALLAAAAPEVLVLDIPGNRLPNGAWRSSVAAAGTTLRVEPFEGYVEFAREAFLAATPYADFARVAAFLSAAAIPSPSATPLPSCDNTLPHLAHDDWAESPMIFGHARDLFGVLCAPHSSSPSTSSEQPAVVILNTGSNHHVGDARYAVVLARRLAARGVASFRVDLGGIGDSSRAIDPYLLGGGPDANRRAFMRLYGQDYAPDVLAALNVLQAHGYGHFTLVGVCSGAKHALDAALNDPRVVGLALGNLPSFGRIPKPDEVPRQTADPQRCSVPFQNRLMRALFGHATRYWLSETLRQSRAAIAGTIGAVLAPVAVCAGIGQAARAKRILCKLSARAAEVLLIYSRDDPGLAELKLCFGPHARGLAKFDGIRYVALDGGDHAFATSHMRDELVSQAEQLISRLYADLQPSSAWTPSSPNALTGDCSDEGGLNLGSFGKPLPT